MMTAAAIVIIIKLKVLERRQDNAFVFILIRYITGMLRRPKKRNVLVIMPWLTTPWHGFEKQIRIEEEEKICETVSRLVFTRCIARRNVLIQKAHRTFEKHIALLETVRAGLS